MTLKYQIIQEIKVNLKNYKTKLIFLKFNSYFRQTTWLNKQKNNNKIRFKTYVSADDMKSHWYNPQLTDLFCHSRVWMSRYIQVKHKNYLADLTTCKKKKKKDFTSKNTEQNNNKKIWIMRRRCCYWCWSRVARFARGGVHTKAAGPEHGVWDREPSVQ